MERDSIAYKTRRKCQVIAHKLFSDETLSKLYYRVLLKKKLNLDAPQTFNEKIQWMKLYYYPQNNLVVKCADKYAVRSYVDEKGYGNKLVPLLGVWDDTNSIDWDKLPDQFVLKCNHGCAYNIVVEDKNTINKKTIVRQLNKWLKEDFGAYNIEVHYSKIIRHCITCEEYLGACIKDYKFFCFNGSPKFIYVSTDLIHDRQAQIGFFYLDGKKMPLIRDDYTDIPQVEFPSFYNEMLDASIKLSEGFPFVRVDFFVAQDNWYFAEMTFTPSAGLMPFNPEHFDAEWGQLIDISELMK